MDDKERSIRQKLKDDFEHYSDRCLRIRTKKGKVEKLNLNKAQRYIHACLEEQRAKTGKVRAIILKGRQQGASTYIGGRYYWKLSHRKGARGFILTHEAESTSALFEMTERYHEHCPILVKPSTGASNAKELIFDRLDSGYKVGTAGNKSVGRGTTIQYFHGSEVAFWPNAQEHAKGILQAVPDADDTEVILESTANGLGNYFHQQWQKAEAGESEYQAIFVPWFWQDEYRKKASDDIELTDEEEELKSIYHIDNDQIQFRRVKIAELSAEGVDGEAAFKQEYPMTAVEAFQTSGGDTLIQPNPVMKARKAKFIERVRGDLILGVDPARFGVDRTSIIRRRGRQAYKLESHKKKSTMEVAGIVHSIILAENPAQVAIDIGGLGAGVYDRLVELGHEDILVSVNFGGSALDPTRYKNKRSEMWCLMNEWLNSDLPVMIPDSDSLHSDLCTPFFSFDSNGRYVLESKENIKKRGMLSPDEGDALGLTFAEPVIRLKQQSQVQTHSVVDSVAGY